MIMHMDEQADFFPSIDTVNPSPRLEGEELVLKQQEFSAGLLADIEAYHTQMEQMGLDPATDI